jgi:hypothetical protein
MANPVDPFLSHMAAPDDPFVRHAGEIVMRLQRYIVAVVAAEASKSDENKDLASAAMRPLVQKIADALRDAAYRT